MKIKLTESSKQFINNLNESDKEKLIITEETIESSDENVAIKLRDFARQEFRVKIHNKLEKSRKETEIFLREHPEYDIK